MSWKRYMTALVLVGVVGCDETGVVAIDGADTPVEETGLKFLRFESSAAVTVREASFWAVKGKNRKLEMNYAPARAGESGEDFLQFEVKSNSLLRKPDGSLFLNGDSVRITVRLDNSDRMIVHFEPSGLIFSPTQPARLELFFEKAKRDIDNDGDDDEDDDELENSVRVWKQERAGLPWIPQLTFKIGNKDIEAKVLSFTGFAMASN